MSLKTIRTLFAAAAASLLMIGCGSEESTPEPPAPATQPAPDTAATPEQESGIIEKMDPDGKGMHITATKPDGKKFEASIGEQVDMPDEFPKDVPVFPGSTPMASMYSPDDGILVTFKSPEEQQAIFDFYQSSLTNDGWDVRDAEGYVDQLSLEARKENRTVTVTVGGRTGDSRVSVIVTTEN
jgi:nitrous oxide reductase accessory protein NosL